MCRVESVVQEARFSKIFKNIGKQKDVEVQIEIVILLHVFDVEFSPHFLSSLVLLRIDSFFEKWAVESVDGRQLGQQKLVCSIHVFIRVIPLCENQIRVRIMPRGMTKFISAIRSQTFDQRVEGSGKQLQAVAKAKIADLETYKFIWIDWNGIDRVGTYSRVMYCIIKSES